MHMVVEVMLEDSQDCCPKFFVRSSTVQSQSPTHPPLHSLRIHLCAPTSVLLRLAGFRQTRTDAPSRAMTFVG
jgi:hypothetical protein